MFKLSSKVKRQMLIQPLNRLFTRRVISKSNLSINHFQLANESLQAQNFEKKEKNFQFELSDSKNQVELFTKKENMGIGLHQDSASKFYLTLKDSLSSLLTNKRFTQILETISFNYPEKDLSRSTLFRFLILVDQIIHKRPLSEYRTFLQAAFPHLIAIFREDFVPLFESSNEALLAYNFLYFMLINKGEFSEAIVEALNHFKATNNTQALNSISNLLKQKLSINQGKQNEELFNTNLGFIDDNFQTASTDLIRDVSFKYNEKYMKERLLKESTEEKQTYHKAKWVLNNIKHFQQNSDNSLKDLEIYVSAFLTKDAKDIFDKDYVELRKQLNTFDSIFQDTVSSLSNLKGSNNIKVTHLREVFNPLFSGRFNINEQFEKVADTFGRDSATSLLQEYTNQKGQIIFFRDLLEFEVILYPNRFTSIKEAFLNTTFLTIVSKPSTEDTTPKKAGQTIFTKSKVDQPKYTFNLINSQRKKFSSSVFQKSSQGARSFHANMQKRFFSQNYSENDFEDKEGVESLGKFFKAKKSQVTEEPQIITTEKKHKTETQQSLNNQGVSKFVKIPESERHTPRPRKPYAPRTDQYQASDKPKKAFKVRRNLENLFKKPGVPRYEQFSFVDNNQDRVDLETYSKEQHEIDSSQTNLGEYFLRENLDKVDIFKAFSSYEENVWTTLLNPKLNKADMIHNLRSIIK